MRTPRFSLLSLLCVLWPFLPACTKQPAKAQGQVLRIAQRNEPATLDPHLATLPDEFFVIRALGEGLLTPNSDGGAPLPGLAESWNASPDGLVYTFKLRADARWSNGEPVTAADFVYTIHRALSPSTTAPKASLFFALRHARAFLRGAVTDFAQVGVEARNTHTLVLSLEQPTADFPALVASGPWIPVHQATVERLGAKWTHPGNFVGTGPYTLEEWSPHQHIIVRKNPAYWDHTNIKLDAIHLVTFDSGDTEDRAFRSGQLDVTLAVPFSKLETYRRASPSVMHTVALHETRYLTLNTTRAPLSDVRVRRALSLALDRGGLVEKVLTGGQRPAQSFVPPGLGGHTPIASLTEDGEMARRLLAEAGFPDGRNFPRLELATWAGVGNLVVEAIQQRWRTELGINVSLVQREARTHLASLAAGDYAIAFVTAIPDYDSATDLLQHLTTGDAGNYPHWSHPKFDASFADRDLKEAERVLIEEMPLIPLYFNAKNYLLRPTVQGWREDPLWTRYYKHVSIRRE